LSDDVTSEVVESSSSGCRINCTVVYHGLLKPEIRLIDAADARVQTDNAPSSVFLQKVFERSVYSAVFKFLTERSFCQISVPLYRCNELSSVYTGTFPTQRRYSATDGEHMHTFYSVIL